MILRLPFVRKKRYSVFISLCSTYILQSVVHTFCVQKTSYSYPFIEKHSLILRLFVSLLSTYSHSVVMLFGYLTRTERSTRNIHSVLCHRSSKPFRVLVVQSFCIME